MIPIFKVSKEQEAEPECMYYGNCSGCHLQHIKYETQVEHKKAHVLFELERNGLKIPENVQVFSKDHYHYKNRLDLWFCKQGPGMQSKDGSKIVPIIKCPLATDKVERVLDELWDFFVAHIKVLDPYNPATGVGTIIGAIIRTADNTDSTSLTIILNKKSEKLNEQMNILQGITKDSHITNIILGTTENIQELKATQLHILSGSEVLTEKINDDQINYSHQSFFQSNGLITPEILSFLNQYFNERESKDATLLDVYGGAGLYSISLATKFKEIKIIDSDQENINCATENIKHLKTASAHCADASEIATFINGNDQTHIILDPPTNGLHPDVITKVMEVKPRSIVYISSHPKQMASELPQFSSHYEIEKMAVFDSAPQTDRLLAVVCLNTKQ